MLAYASQSSSKDLLMQLPMAGRGPDEGASAHAARTELHADPRADRPGRLRGRVLPVALQAATHHQQVTPAQLEPSPLPPAPGPQQQSAPRPQGDDGHHGVLG